MNEPIYEVIWYDPVTYTDEEIKFPLKDRLVIRRNVGWIIEDGDCLAIVAADFIDQDEKDRDYTVVPKSLIKEMRII